MRFQKEITLLEISDSKKMLNAILIIFPCNKISNISPTQVKCRLLISSIFFTEFLAFFGKYWNLSYSISQKMLEIKNLHLT